VLLFAIGYFSVKGCRTTYPSSQRSRQAGSRRSPPAAPLPAAGTADCALMFSADTKSIYI